MMFSAPGKTINWLTLVTMIGCLALSAAIWAVTLERMDHESKNAIADSVRNNENLALAFEEHTIRVMREIDSALMLLGREHQRKGKALDIRTLFKDHLFDRALLRSAAIVDEHGDIVLSSDPAAKPVNAADREYFEFHRRNPGGGLSIGKPLISRLTNELTILMTRRIDRPDGSFGGVAVIGLDPEYFIRFYERVDVGNDGQVMLIGLDGIVRARRTGGTMSAGTDFRGRTLFKELLKSPDGQFTTRGQWDPTTRYLSYRTVKGLPLVVAVGSSQSDLVLEDRARNRYYLSTAALASVTILLLGAAVLLVIRRHRQAVDETMKSAARYGAAFDQATLGMAHFSTDGRYLKANARLRDMLGYTEAELLLRTFGDGLHPSEASPGAASRSAFDRDAPAQPSQFDCQQVRKDGSVLWTAVSLTAVRDVGEELQYVLGIVEDITERKSAEQALLRINRELTAVTKSNRIAAAVIQNAAEGVMVIDDALKIASVNPAFEAITGFSAAEVLGRTPRILFSGKHDDTFFHQLHDLVDGNGTWRGEIWNRRRNGEIYPQETSINVLRDADGRISHYASIFSDKTTRNQMETRLRELSSLDALTGIANRRSFDEMLVREMERARRYHAPCALIMLDIDHFKHVNDTFGHQAGDDLLVALTAFISANIRDSDALARWGGEEFMVMAPGAGLDEAQRLAEKLRSKIEGGDFGEIGKVTCSFGVTQFEPRDTPQDFVGRVDEAMYDAKRTGRNRVVVARSVTAAA